MPAAPLFRFTALIAALIFSSLNILPINLMLLLLLLVDLFGTAELPFCRQGLRSLALGISSAPDCPNIAYSDLHYSCIRSFSISVSIPTMTSADPRLWTFYRTYHSDMPDGSLGVIHISFAPQPLDLLSWLYVYLSDFGLSCNLIHHLALYQVSVRRLKSFATPLPPPLTLLLEACGSLRLAVNTRDWTFTN